MDMWRIIRHLDTINKAYDFLQVERGTPVDRIVLKPGVSSQRAEQAIRRIERSQAALGKKLIAGLEEHHAKNKKQ